MSRTHVGTPLAGNASALAPGSRVLVPESHEASVRTVQAVIARE